MQHILSYNNSAPTHNNITKYAAYRKRNVKKDYKRLIVLYYTIIRHIIEKSMLLNEIMFNVKFTKICILHIGNINKYNMTKITFSRNIC